MRRVMTLLASAAIVLCSTGVASASAVLYGANGNQGSTPGGLLTVDPTTGATVLIADSITPGGLTGIAFASPSLLFGTTIGGNGSLSNLVLLDPVTGALVSTIGSIGMSIGDLAYDSGTGTLYGVRSNADSTGNGGELYSINTSTGVATFVGDTGAGAGGGWRSILLTAGSIRPRTTAVSISRR